MVNIYIYATSSCWSNNVLVNAMQEDKIKTKQFLKLEIDVANLSINKSIYPYLYY